MYIFRWLMKHPVIILALYFLSIAAILYSMTRGSSIETGVSDSGQINSEESAKVDLSAAPKIEPSTLSSALVKEEPTTESTENKVTNSDSTQAIDDGGESETEIAEPATKEVAAQEITSTDETQAVDDGGESETEVAAQAISSTDQAQTDTQFSEMTAEELLLMAREAYWNNGLEESAQIYQQLIELSPDVIDYKGELGNVYWRQGFPKKAAELYAEISIPMIEEGYADRVANMVGFIGLFFPEKATEIHNLLQDAK